MGFEKKRWSPKTSSVACASVAFEVREHAVLGVNVDGKIDIVGGSLGLEDVGKVEKKSLPCAIFALKGERSST